MNMENRIKLIQLLNEELVDTALRFAKVASEKEHTPVAGYDVSMLDSKEALKRRITVLREELLELSKKL